MWPKYPPFCRIKKHHELCRFRIAKVKAKARAKGMAKAKAAPVAAAHAEPEVAPAAPELDPPAGPAPAVPPPPVADLAPPAAAPPPAPVARRPHNRAGRRLRGEPFGALLVLAPVHQHGVFTAWSCRCCAHTSDGAVCNKTLTMGATFSAEEAKQRIMEWCLRGLGLPDEPGSRALHMQDDPRNFDAAEVRPMAQLMIDANAA